MLFFSIIVPTYNSEQTFRKCLESILCQSFTDFEILIIDGVSADKTLEIGKSFEDERIKIFSEKDSGIYDAMNKGIKFSKGNWLYFLGSDDALYSPTVLSDVYSQIQNMNVDILYGNVVSDRFNGKYDGAFNYEKLLNKNICHQSIFFNKKVFCNVGNFNLKYRALSDYDHNLRWFLNKKINVKYFDCTIANYSDNGYSSVTSDDAFLQDKNYNYIVYGYNSVSKPLLFGMCKRELKNSQNSLNRKIIIGLITLYLFVRKQ